MTPDKNKDCSMTLIGGTGDNETDSNDLVPDSSRVLSIKMFA